MAGTQRVTVRLNRCAPGIEMHVSQRVQSVLWDPGCSTCGGLPRRASAHRQHRDLAVGPQVPHPHAAVRGGRHLGAGLYVSVLGSVDYGRVQPVQLRET